ncbi:hypothetical protein Sme01_70360 [Sphaerisporangium melleum]|uniref:Uncharacterized protein n=1 Tax=Sphaerisporangium melleum TaxID=321316 RepID=A0A917VT86_9ACTN|nr:hypothetical protein [Sphaerisporangium melleum]GGL15453.1 hypothetical protein GCM10007964_66820 [Sphaerisporangium melleum]GII74560.1 hypothetical protein Sme01_70360 [Sphaerisporangium melleum]
MRPALSLTYFKITAYLRSHRVILPFGGLLVVMAILYSVRVNVGQELPSYADSAALLVPVFAWAARGLLDAEPDVQRLLSITAVGRPGREVASGLLAAVALNAALALVALVVPLAIGFSATPGPQALLGGLALHLLSLLTGTAIGALTSRPILPDPAVAALTLLGGYAGILLLSLVPVTWLTVPIISWMRAAGQGDFLGRSLPGLAGATLFWCAVALFAYTRLRRTRP